METNELNDLYIKYAQESDEFRGVIEANLVYLGTFGLNDPIRDDARESIHLIRFGHSDITNTENGDVNVRMVTGDHIETAKNVALRLGIIDDNEKELDGAILTGLEFRARIGPYKKVYDKDS